MEANTLSDEISNHLLQLRKVLEGHDILKKFEFDENYLIRFLHGSNFHVPVALKRILDFHLLYLSDYTWFSTDGPADKIEILNMNTMIGLPLRDKDGRRVILVKLGNLDASVGTMVMHVHLFHMWYEHLIQDELTLFKGFCILIDVNSFPWGMFKWLTPNNIKTAIKMVENYPVKEMMFHVLNKSYLLQAAVKLVWPFLSKELQEKIKFHFTNWTSLHQFIDPLHLPKEYGGSGPDLDFQVPKEMLLEEGHAVSERLRQNFVFLSNV